MTTSGACVSGIGVCVFVSSRPNKLGGTCTRIVAWSCVCVGGSGWLRGSSYDPLVGTWLSVVEICVPGSSIPSLIARNQLSEGTFATRGPATLPCGSNKRNTFHQNAFDRPVSRTSSCGVRHAILLDTLSHAERRSVRTVHVQASVRL